MCVMVSRQISNVTVLLVVPNMWKGLLSIHFSRKLRLKFLNFLEIFRVFVTCFLCISAR